jgi:Acyl-CoA thioesterase C-terminal domain/Acyl-CoA thioesterase N-terminal domain
VNDQPDPLFRSADGGRFLPGPTTRGPWTADALHGAPPALLLARAVERAEGGADHALARLTVELVRPIPCEPLTVRAEVTRPGRKVSYVEASLTLDDGTVAARASAWRVRRLPVTARSTERPAPRPPDRCEPPDHWSVVDWSPAFHTDGLEMRFAAGGFQQPGPATTWFRLCQPVVDEEFPSPALRAVAAADFPNGISSPYRREDGWSFINMDVSLFLARHPEGEWIAVDARTEVGPSGAVVAHGVLFDERGEIGLSVQTVLIEPPTSVRS